MKRLTFLSIIAAKADPDDCSLSLHGLGISGDFNPRRVKVGQWFTRLSIGPDPLPSPVRGRIASIQKDSTGSIITLSTFKGIMGVCPHTLKQDFCRIVDKNRQPWTGEELPVPTTAQPIKPAYWNEKD